MTFRVREGTREPADHATEHYAKAVWCHAAGRHAEAEQLYRAVLERQPDHAQSLHMLGVIALQAEKWVEACSLLSSAVPALAGSADVHNHLGLALEQLGRFREAAVAYRTSLHLQPSYVIANNLGVVLQKTGDNEGALASFAQAIALRPDCAEAHNNLGAVLDRLDRCGEAMHAYARALELRPDYAGAHLNMGIALRAQGDTAEALAAVERALAADPSFAYAWYISGELKTFEAGDASIPRLEALLAADCRTAQERIDLCFALGKAKLDAGDTDGAFESYKSANLLKRRMFTYSVEAQTANLLRIAGVFRPELMQRFSGCGRDSDLPVFIVGMPRSGTTLVEQILASHVSVLGGGELPIPDGVDMCLRAFTDASDIGQPLLCQALCELAPKYLDGLARGASWQRVTNKAMGLFRYVGLFHLMLPGARFIYCRRDAMDTCFSCYTKNFAEQQYFAYDLHELGTFHVAFEQLMTHWCEVLPAGRLLIVDYEAIVEDLEGEARRMVSFLGLDWDESCLWFHKTRRRIRTASVDQVRRPIYDNSIGRWRPFAAHLEPLAAALGRKMW